MDLGWVDLNFGTFPEGEPLLCISTVAACWPNRMMELCPISDWLASRLDTLYKDISNRQCYVSGEALVHLARTPRSAIEVETGPELGALVLAASFFADPAPQANGSSAGTEFVLRCDFLKGNS